MAVALLLSVAFIGLWLSVSAVLAAISGWSRLAQACPDRPDIGGRRLLGLVTAVGYIQENGITALEVTPGGLRLEAHLLFRFRRPAVLVPWEDIRGIERRRFLWRRHYVLDLAGLTSLTVKEGGLDLLRDHLSGRAAREAERLARSA